ncbi:S41 family peptidase [Aurantiacibacter gangjinensis]|uniref:S41 family peptidase n=1 Tax=Aurantiacibacter gangjinensis TaxID=502682 RepID=UPI00090B46C4|nr:PDZ domain-containing protein [Aurantiacibacter gangjinensis]APE27386.1 hypothetical protein BMF35_a0557 [Aurantiacibacter gangjinensis]
MLASASCLACAPVAERPELQTAAVTRSGEYAQAALAFPALVNAQYAYLEQLPGGTFTLTPALEVEARAVQSENDLLRFLERALMLLADHHAHTGASFADSYALVPSYADLWVENRANRFIITSVREESPAALAGVRTGDRLVAIDGLPVEESVAAFWADLGAQRTAQRDAFAARVLASGRRDRSRELTIESADGLHRDVTLPSLYDVESEQPAIAAERSGTTVTITINDALGDFATVAAFDDAMEGLGDGDRLVLNLTNTPSGGNTTVARGIMGWFAAQPTPYQMHELPAEERQFGIIRRWQEWVLPREGRYFAGPVEVRVGRWTGSMGEGLAIGMAELGACVNGEPMAGLLGAIGSYDVGGLTVRLPFERLGTVDGLPREDFVPQQNCPSN